MPLLYPTSCKCSTESFVNSASPFPLLFFLEEKKQKKIICRICFCASLYILRNPVAQNGRLTLANTHKDNNEIPLRAREVLPENRKDFSNYWNLLFYSHGSLSSGMRRYHRCDFTTFPIRRKPIYLGIEILLDQHNRGNCKVREEPHKSYFRLVDDFQKCFFDCVC